MRRNVIAGLLLGALACGGESVNEVRTRNGPTQFSGVSAQFRRSQGSLSGQPFGLLSVGVFDIPEWCTPLDGGPGPTSVATLVLELIRAGADPVGAGTYAVVAHDGEIHQGATGWFQRLVNAEQNVGLEATAGSVRLSRSDATGVEGEVELSLEDGTRLEGHFSAVPQCFQ